MKSNIFIYRNFSTGVKASMYAAFADGILTPLAKIYHWAELFFDFINSRNTIWMHVQPSCAN